MRLGRLLAYLAVLFTALATETYFLDYERATTCFAVTDTGATYLSAQISSFELRELGKPKTLEMIAYRKVMIDEEHVFQGEHASLRLCVPEAVENGYCQEEELGHFLYKVNEDGLDGADYKPLFNGVFSPGSTGLNDDEVVIKYPHIITVAVEEPGYYCVRSYARWAKTYKVVITVEDGHSFSKNEKYHLKIRVLDLLLDATHAVVLIYLWVGISMPFLVKWFLIRRAVVLIFATWKIYNIFIHEIKDINETPGPVFEILRSSSDLWLTLYIFYQYSREFTYNKITEFDETRLFIIIQLANLIDFAVEFMKVHTGHVLIDFVPLIVAGALKAVIEITRKSLKFYLYYKMYRRYTQTVKTYTDFNKAEHPLLKQFQWEFFQNFARYYILVLLVFIVVGAQMVLLPKVSDFYKDNFMIDGYGNLECEYRAVLIVTPIFILFDLYLTWNYWRPEYFKQVQDYKERHD